MARRGKSAREKGRRAEIEFFKVLNKFLPERLHLKRDLSQARDSGADGISADFAIEVKRQERLSLGAWLAQAQGSATSAQVPVVAYRQNGRPWNCLVSMTPVQLAAYMRYRNNLKDTEAALAAAPESSPR